MKGNGNWQLCSMCIHEGTGACGFPRFHGLGTAGLIRILTDAHRYAVVDGAMGLPRMIAGRTTLLSAEEQPSERLLE